MDSSVDRLGLGDKGEEVANVNDASSALTPWYGFNIERM